MRPRVTAILVAHDGADYLRSTLEALAAQTRQPERTIIVDISRERIVVPAQVAREGLGLDPEILTAAAGLSFGEAVRAAVATVKAAESENDWLWLLSVDNAPRPKTLERLLGAVEIAPSVVVAGPKQMQWADSDYLLSFGDTLTRFGTAVEIAEPELDQGQYDRHSDVLAVAAGGMLVRQRIWEELGGFDRGLPAVDDALDFCVRARLAGHRVAMVPNARILSAGRHAPGTAVLGRHTSRGKRARLTRAAQLHRRLVYAPLLAVPVHWLSLVPLAFGRAFGQLLRKAPGSVLGEFGAAFGAAFAGLPSAFAARRTLRRTKRVGWKAIAPLRQSWTEVRHRRALLRESVLEARRSGSHPIRFFSGGGGWVVLGAGVLGGVVFGGLLGSSALSGGGLLPLSSLSSLWAQVGYGWRDIGLGFMGAADPFALVLALLGSLTFWSPSFSVVLLYVLALPLAALASWIAAARLTPRASSRAIAAVLWTLAPSFLIALDDGRLGAVLAHLLLPWLVTSALGARRSWSAAATAALLAAGVTAAAPSLIPALMVLWGGSLIALTVAGRAGRGRHRLLLIPLPTLALFAPLAIQQLLRGTLLGVLADPGVPVAAASFDSSLPVALSSALHLLAGLPDGSVVGWEQLAPGVGSSVNGIPSVLLVVLPFIALALLALFQRGTLWAASGLVVAALGYATAVVASRVQLTSDGAVPVAVWPGAGLSLYWLGLVSAAVVCLSLGTSLSARRVRGAVAGISLAGVLAVGAPLLLAPALGESPVEGSDGTSVPALVSAEAGNAPQLGTIVIAAQADGGVAGRIVRGDGAHLDSSSTLYSTDPAGGLSLGTLVGNLVSRSGFDAAAEFQRLGVGFVLLEPSSSQQDDASVVRERAIAALDGNPLLTPIAATADGALWRYVGLDDAAPVAPVPGPGNTETALGIAVLAVQALIVGFTFLLALPTGALAERLRPERTVRRGSGLTGQRTDKSLAEEAEARPDDVAVVDDWDPVDSRIPVGAAVGGGDGMAGVGLGEDDRDW